MIRSLLAISLSLLFIVSLRAENTDKYTHAGRDGLILADRDIWYYEEFDTRGRPVEGVRWEKNSIVERTSWMYHADSQQVFLSITTNKDLVTETEYDRDGNILAIRETVVPKEDDAGDTAVDPDSPAQKRVINYSYDGQNRLRETVSRSGTALTKIQFDYRDDGTLQEKRVYKNNVLSIRYVYKDEENWIETVYHDDIPVLTVVYQDGERKRILYETW